MIRFDCGQFGVFTVVAVYLRFSAVVEPQKKWRLELYELESSSSVKLHLRHKRTEGRTDSAGNRI